MKSLLLIVICSIACASCIGQGLTLTKNGKTRTFDEKTALEMALVRQYESDESKCCERIELIGYVTSLGPDSLGLRLNSYTRTTLIDDLEVKDVLQSNAGTLNMSIAQRDIYFVQSAEASKRKTAFNIAGGLLLFTGAATALHAILVDGKSNKNTLLISAGAQVGLGIGFVIAGRPKKYYLKDSDDVWSIRN